MRKKTESNIFKNSICENFSKELYFVTCILPDHVFHDSPKEFWKNNHFENIRPSFFRRCQNSPWQTTHEIKMFSIPIGEIYGQVAKSATSYYSLIVLPLTNFTLHPLTWCAIDKRIKDW